MALKVLVVDDAGFIRHILGTLLQDLGCLVVGEARTGSEAVERAKMLRPDVIFMDMVLPGQNGAEAAVEILADNPAVQIIAMSTAAEEIVRERALMAGCRHFICKPFRREPLRALLDEVEAWRVSSTKGAS